MVSSITIAEVAQIYRQRDKRLVTVRTDDVSCPGEVVPVTFEIARLAGQLRNTEIDGGIADAIILATAPAHFVKDCNRGPALQGQKKRRISRCMSAV